MSSSVSTSSSSAVFSLAGKAAIAAAIAFGTTYYYWLIIKPRRLNPQGRKGRVVTDVDELQVLSAATWKGMWIRGIYRPFVTTINIMNDAHLPPAVSLHLHYLPAIVDVTLSGCALQEIPVSVYKLQHLRRLDLSNNNIASVSAEIASLKSLEDLNLGNNLLTSLPAEIGALVKLNYLNLMANRLQTLPHQIGDLVQLYRLGLKSNRLKALPDTMGNMQGLVELFVTDNRLVALPATLGKLKKLFKFQASFNQLHALPAQLSQLQNLELFRVAVNKITFVPLEFSALNSLSWFSLSGNPACASPPISLRPIPEISMDALVLGPMLGNGASGDVFSALWGSRPVAFKRFKSETSPDGQCRDEIAVSCSLNHPNIVRVLACVREPQGIVMEKVEGRAMAEKPNFSSLLRCRWASGVLYHRSYVVRVASCMADALTYLHSLNVCHGDFYAHNVVADMDGHAVLCDFGAAFCYAKNGFQYEAYEIRAFGLFLKDLVERLTPSSSLREEQVEMELKALVSACIQTVTSERQRFSEVLRVLDSIQKEGFT